MGLLLALGVLLGAGAVPLGGPPDGTLAIAGLLVLVPRQHRAAEATALALAFCAVTCRNVEPLGAGAYAKAPPAAVCAQPAETCPLPARGNGPFPATAWRTVTGS